MGLIVLESSWQWARLWWYADDGWLAVMDRVRERLDDATVDQRFGSEAFRRRDALVARGLPAGEFEPLGVPLVGRAVTEKLREHGWQVDDALHYRWVAERSHDSARVELLDGRLQVAVEISDVTVEGETMDLGALERAVLAVTIDGKPPAAAFGGVVQEAAEGDG
ncbi:hypothetical protein [Agrococcus baldri]|uniref:Uncharacterized protein n=1 Tax=Agrococcus baldri TaxID=153730 RepID=A0AA87RDH8_9MICO|nr:hypothetical protein [Agrococcus baldri]GEK80692.1 hypothetical protein ABA31_20430 [Agrococcus baldri]